MPPCHGGDRRFESGRARQIASYTRSLIEASFLFIAWDGSDLRGASPLVERSFGNSDRLETFARIAGAKAHISARTGMISCDVPGSDRQGSGGADSGRSLLQQLGHQRRPGRTSCSPVREGIQNTCGIAAESPQATRIFGSFFMFATSCASVGLACER